MEVNITMLILLVRELGQLLLVIDSTKLLLCPQTTQ
jgi:hypothetical protein